MDSEAVYECSYQYEDLGLYIGDVFVGFFILACVCCFTAIVSLSCFHSILLTLLLLAAGLILGTAIIVRHVSANKRGIVQLMKDRIRILEYAGTPGLVLWFRDVSDVYADPARCVIIRYTEKVGPCAEKQVKTAVLKGVDNPGMLVEAVGKQLMMYRIRHEKPVETEPEPLQVQAPIQEDPGINEIHAAEHLLRQGMITPQQMADMYRQPEQEQPLSQDEINARNAASYMRRNEMLAQQLGGAQEQDTKTDEKENEAHERPGII